MSIKEVTILESRYRKYQQCEITLSRLAPAFADVLARLQDARNVCYGGVTSEELEEWGNLLAGAQGAVE